MRREAAGDRQHRGTRRHRADSGPSRPHCGDSRSGASEPRTAAGRSPGLTAPSCSSPPGPPPRDGRVLACALIRWHFRVKGEDSHAGTTDSAGWRPRSALSGPVSARCDGLAPDIMAPYMHYPPWRFSFGSACSPSLAAPISRCSRPISVLRPWKGRSSSWAPSASCWSSSTCATPDTSALRVTGGRRPKQSPDTGTVSGDCFVAAQ